MKAKACEMKQGDEWITSGVCAVVKRVEAVEPQHVRVFVRMYPANCVGYDSSLVLHHDTPVTLDYRPN